MPLLMPLSLVNLVAIIVCVYFSVAVVLKILTLNGTLGALKAYSRTIHATITHEFCYYHRLFLFYLCCCFKDTDRTGTLGALKA